MTVLLSERRHDYDVAYIRKDALLEWAKEERNKHWKAFVENNSHNDEDSFYAMERLIDKLNSL
jgi:aminoglycoside/choline kinase family phosphotransferase